MLFYNTQQYNINQSRQPLIFNISFVPKSYKAVVKKFKKNQNTWYNYFIGNRYSQKYKNVVLILKSKKMKHYFNEYHFIELNPSNSFATKYKRVEEAALFWWQSLPVLCKAVTDSDCDSAASSLSLYQP